MNKNIAKCFFVEGSKENNDKKVNNLLKIEGIEEMKARKKSTFPIEWK